MEYVLWGLWVRYYGEVMLFSGYHQSTTNVTFSFRLGGAIKEKGDFTIIVLRSTFDMYGKNGNESSRLRWECFPPRMYIAERTCARLHLGVARLFDRRDKNYKTGI